MASTPFLNHVRNYASAGMLASVAGLVTFPILTRNLTIEDYGLVGLVTASLTLAVALGKLGLQHSVIRYFSQVDNDRGRWSLSQLGSTVFLLFGILAIITTSLWLFVGLRVVPQVLESPKLPALFVAASGLVFVRLSSSSIINFLRAQERSALVGFYQVCFRFLALALLLLTLLVFPVLTPLLFICGMLIAECIAVCIVFRRFRIGAPLTLTGFSATLTRALLVFGLPLMVLESLGLVLRLSDRYLIEGMLGATELGQYSASYNLTQYLEVIVLSGLVQAVKPRYNALWEREGAATTQAFLARGLQVCLVLGIPLITVFSLTAPHLLNILASPKFEAGTVIIPYVATSYLIEGALVFLGAGLYLFKNTRVLMFSSALATIANLALNVILIPKYGIMGAAAATVVSIILFSYLVTRAAFSRVSFRISLQPVILVTILSIGLYIPLKQWNMDIEFFTFFVKGSVATLLLVAGIYIIDDSVAEFMRHWFHKLIRRKTA